MPSIKPLDPSLTSQPIAGLVYSHGNLNFAWVDVDGVSKIEPFYVGDTIWFQVYKKWKGESGIMIEEAAMSIAAIHVSVHYETGYDKEAPAPAMTMLTG